MQKEYAVAGQLEQLSGEYFVLVTKKVGRSPLWKDLRVVAREELEREIV